MTSKSIRHLPVVEDGEMVGFITESNIRQYLSQPVDDLTVADVMIVNPITIDHNASIDSAARLIHAYKIGGLPVLEKRKLTGIITTIDILAAFIELMGLLEESSRIDVAVDESKGSIEDVMKIVRSHGGTVVSIGLDTSASRKKVYYIRLKKIELDEIVKSIEGAGHKVISVLD
jgi:acetoin utilization protein AcuB